MEPYKETVDAVISEYQADLDNGLTENSVEEKIKNNGKNKFEEAPKESLAKKFFHSLTDFTTIILLVAAVISLYTAIATDHGDYFESFLIIAIVVINSVLAIVQEGNAEKALSALQDMNKQTATVIRDGKQQEIDAEELVPGDTLLLESGSMITADARIAEASQLRVEESALTGESEPVMKDSEYLGEADDALGDRLNMLYKGSTVVNGRGKAIITATGMETEMGKIAGLLNSDENQKTPLQKRLNQLGKRISLIALAAAAFVFFIGEMQGEPMLDMFITAISLAVAAVPETLTVIVTLTLAFGVQKMAQKNAIIRRLPAVETLGSANVICSDKTGTLTQNKMRVRRVWTHGDSVVDTEEGMTEEAMEVLSIAALCTDVVVENDDNELEIKGNPTEAAIVRAVEENYHTKAELEEKYPRIGEIPFDSERKMMTTVHKRGKKFISITKGAFDVLLPKFHYGDVDQAAIVNDRFGKKALRVIAVGYAIHEEEPKEITSEALEKNLRLMGLIGMIDPPRPESKAAIARAKKAGIKTVMITGDHVVTAGAIAKELGIMKSRKEAISGAQLQKMTDEELDGRVKNLSVYARVTPEDKIRIVKSWQRTGAVVAMTGDGVNDAPALKASDVGCAMGITGTDVAKGAADMVLTDDNFATIVDAVARGRSVYQGIRKAINFLLSCNISEIFIVVIAMLLGWGAPFTAVQLLFVNVVADGLPGFALGREPAEAGIMDEKPIPRDEGIFARGLWQKIGLNAAIFTVVTLIGFYIGAFVEHVSYFTPPSLEVGQTVAFLVLAFSSILHVFNVRSSKSIFKIDLATNKSLAQMAWLALGITTAIALIPQTQELFYLVPISMNHWVIAILLSIVPIVVTELIKFHKAPEVDPENI
ncbi:MULTISPECIES: cation-translocating P-type ATPase [Enterococcus]|uniref:P-type Ca(2+) transporter n=1 Tax=Enterococcus malodoratus ATCC 43197 TaxID=1158601 RepID=R2NKD0_9ENTE|nr:MULTISPECIES: cation-translocating P-type ATPase [Enterococcus]BBM19615.1 calcium-translocating P-type ATPase, PMCA-type [Enterococcus avium]EOH72492.1 calcium-translocating P-type ATPase, PMCA-type [Enterococcus malodoratus ATCC 43197]EOT70182.1 calcium-translocating P-type ATPase, PMCA-type [Enterococcus malodoratus ATCC 43197]OJG66384.1 calcium-translocating P-type ATPase, PMCA-type [Enterococcus malodoratus]SET85450.1 plasma-membrane calcium-translocating P-type ATPase [Enterococcus mal